MTHNMNWHVMQRQLQPSKVRGSSSTTLSRRQSVAVAAVFVSGLFSACAGGGSSASGETANVNALTGQPDTTIGSAYFLGDDHFGGDASNLNLESMHWGRLVNITAKGADVVLRDFVIGSNVKDGTTFTPSVGPTITYSLSRNPITDQYTLRIGAQENTGQSVNEITPGSTRFIEALKNLEKNLTPIFDKSLSPSEIGPYSMIPRNAAVVVLFSDLLEPVYRNGGWHDLSAGDVVNTNTGQLEKSLVKIGTGYPPVTPYETRVFLDPNHGNLADRDGDGNVEYYSTRVIVSGTVSGIEALASDPPLAINSIGLPESLVPDDTNLAFRIPTLVSAGLGQSQVLRNASGRVINFDSNGSNDPVSGTRDIVRALRSGGSLTQDPNNGFLLDDDAPSLLGDQSVAVQTPTSYSGCTDCTKMDIAFDVTVCDSIKIDDIVTQSTQNGQVNGVVRGWDVSGTLETGAGNVSNTSLNVVVQILGSAPGAAYNGGSARVGTHYEVGDVAECFVRFSPPALIAPSTGVQPDATAFLLFSEPMDPTTIRAYDSFTIKRTDTDPPTIPNGLEFATGRVLATADLRTFRWEHSGVPFSHTNGNQESFTVDLAAGENGPRDLAGNPLALSLDAFNFSLDSSAPTDLIGSFTFRFKSPGDDLYGDELSEIRDNQIIYDLQNERLLPRPVTRFSATADTSQPLPGIMTAFAGGLQTPLSNLGSKLQTLWRYTDVGFSLTDETNFNVDIEGISWSPVGGAVTSDIYDAFSVGVSHSLWLPDEILNTGSGFPQYPASGLKAAFANNLADLLNDPMHILHPKELGYVVSSQNLYISASGTPMLPFPVNEDVALEDRLYYTWRDTALLFLGGGLVSQNGTGNGAPLDSEIAALGLDGTKIYSRGEIPTVGLPLLMEFRCYSSDAALGLNAFDIALAANSSPRPNFRAFSTGGYAGSVTNFVNPDDEDVAMGGYNPTSNPPGQSTPPTDNTFYFGELALVTRVSRVHSVLLDTGAGYTRFAVPSIEPEPSAQPSGTFVNLSYRGVSNQNVPDDIVAGPTGGSAQSLTPYGNRALNSNFSYLDPTGSWKDDITDLVGARYFQFRVSFVSNAATDRTAELRTLAFPYFKTDPSL
jgi:hypothetical protein